MSSGNVVRLVGIAGVVFLVIHFAMMSRIQGGHQTDDDLLANRMRMLNTRLRRLERIHREEIDAQNKEDDFVFGSRVAAIEQQLAREPKLQTMNIDDAASNDTPSATPVHTPSSGTRLRRRRPTPPAVAAATTVDAPVVAVITKSSPTKRVPSTKPVVAEFDFPIAACANEDFGDGLITRWRAAGRDACTGDTAVSHMMGYSLTQARHTGPDHTFGMTKVRFQDGSFTMDCHATSVIKTGASTNHVYQPNHDIYRFIDSSRYGVPFDRDITWDNTPTMFITRDCPPPFNIFHCSASMINVVTTAIMYNVDLKDVRILFLDNEPESFMPIWNALAGKGAFIKSKWGQHTDMYLNTAIIAIPAGGSFMWKDGWKASPCAEKSPILLRYNRIVWRAVLGDDYQLPAVMPHKVVLFSRRTAGYRRAHNEDQLAQTIRDELKIEVVVADMGSIPFADQVKLVNSATLLIGMHGAALTHINHLVDPSRVAVIEMFTEQADRPTFFENFCLWLSCRQYRAWVGPGKVNEGVNVDIPAIVKWARELTA